MGCSRGAAWARRGAVSESGVTNYQLWDLGANAETVNFFSVQLTWAMAANCPFQFRAQTLGWAILLAA